MPSNRRSGTNRQPAARRPKVAGLRKRPAPPASTEDAAKPEEEHVNGTAVTGRPEAEEAGTSEAAGTSATSGTSGAESGSEAAEDKAAEPESPEPEPESAETKTAEPAAEEAEPQVSEAVAAEDPEPEAAESGTDESTDSDEKSAPAGKPWVLWGATALLAALAIFFGVATYATYNTGPAANEALTSAGATSEVNGQVSDGIEKLFSYDFNDTAKTENAARDLLVGDAVQKYNELFALVKQQAPQQQLIVTTTVKNSAVTRLEGDRAEVLVFVDQHAMRANTGESNIGPAQLSVSAEKQGDQWKITQLTLR